LKLPIEASIGKTDDREGMPNDGGGSNLAQTWNDHQKQQRKV